MYTRCRPQVLGVGWAGSVARFCPWVRKLSINLLQNLIYGNDCRVLGSPLFPINEPSISDGYPTRRIPGRLDGQICDGLNQNRNARLHLRETGRQASKEKDTSYAGKQASRDMGSGMWDGKQPGTHITRSAHPTYLKTSHGIPIPFLHFHLPPLPNTSNHQSCPPSHCPDTSTHHIHPPHPHP